MQVRDNRLYLDEIAAEELARQYGTPLYAYEEEVILRRYAGLVENIPYDGLRVHYACKANSNLEILRALKGVGARVETVSQGEVLLAFQAGFSGEEVIYTCSNISEAELRFLVEDRIMVDLQLPPPAGRGAGQGLPFAADPGERTGVVGARHFRPFRTRCCPGRGRFETRSQRRRPLRSTAKGGSDPPVCAEPDSEI